MSDGQDASSQLYKAMQFDCSTHSGPRMRLRRKKLLIQMLSNAVVLVNPSGLEPDCQRQGCWRVLNGLYVGRLN